MPLLVETPDTRAPERDYILGVVLGDFLGLPWRRVAGSSIDTRITFPDYAGELRMPDCFLSLPDDKWLIPASLPGQPLLVWDSSELGLNINLIDSRLPIIYGDLGFPARCHSSGEKRAAINEDQIFLPLDIFGSAFFMLTRYEEIVKPDRDERDRFPAWASLAYQEGFLDRPIIDEYVEVIWSVMKILWPRLQRRKNLYQVNLSHDVDSVLYGPFANPISLGKQIAGDFFKTKDGNLAWKRFVSVLDAKRGYHDGDPHNTFDFIMNCSERYGLKSAFYFMTGGAHKSDANYDIYMPWIKELIRNIGERRHEVGIHPSYETYLDPKATRDEFQALLNVAEECNIRQVAWGGRQHNLRWSARQTWKNWEEAGLTYDSSLGYAQHAGFRTGSCFEYCTFDLIDRKALSLRERPLIVMEGTLFNRRYMRLSYKESAFSIQELSKTCKLLKGRFTLLWHNNKLLTKKDKQFYSKLLETII